MLVYVDGVGVANAKEEGSNIEGAMHDIESRRETGKAARESIPRHWRSKGVRWRAGSLVVLKLVGVDKIVQ